MALAGWLPSRKITQVERIVLDYSARASAVAACVSAALPGPSCLILDLLGLDPVRDQQERMLQALEAALVNRANGTRSRPTPSPRGVARAHGPSARARIAKQALADLAKLLLRHKLLRSFGRHGAKISPIAGTAFAAACAFQQTRLVGLRWLEQAHATFQEVPRESRDRHH